MATKFKEWAGRNRTPILIAGVLLMTGAIVAAIATGVVWWLTASERADGQTNPVFVDTSTGTSTDTSGDGWDSGSSSGVAGGLHGGIRGEAGDDNLVILLSAGQAQPEAVEPVSVAAGDPLSEEEIEQILARLPELITDPQDQVDFRLPEDLLPPPRTGETIEEPFPPPPPPVTPEQVEAGPLEVLRFAPEGEIPLAPFVNVTFNQPMVPLTTIEALTAEEVPVRLEPALPGVWKWLGTKTLSFEYDSSEIDRLPMATEYVATVPAGTESATGGVLAETVRWTFSTPPPGSLPITPRAGRSP